MANQPRRARRTGSEYVDNLRERDITFFKRRNGLFKAASDLSILTGASIAVVLEDRNREKYHAVGTPTVEKVVNAVLSSDNMEVTEPLVDEQTNARLTALENELALVTEESVRKEETTQASKDRYKKVQKEEEDDDENDLKMKRLFFPKSNNLELDQINELFTEILQIREQVRERLPPLNGNGRRGESTLLNFGGSRVPPRARPPRPAQWRPSAAAQWRRTAAAQWQQTAAAQWRPPQLSNRFGSRNRQLHVGSSSSSSAPFVADRALPPPPAPPVTRGSLLIPELPPPATPGSPWGHLLPLKSPRFAPGTEPPYFGIQAQQAQAHVNNQLQPEPLQMPVENHFAPQAHVNNQVATLSTILGQPGPLQMPVENHFPPQAPLMQGTLPFSNQAPAFAPVSAPLQMHVEDYPVSPLLQEQFSYPDQAPQFAPMPVSSEMPMQANFPHSQLMQDPVPFSNEAPVVVPPQASLQMPVEAHFPNSQLLQQPLTYTNQAPQFAPMPVSSEMPMQANFPHFQLMQQPLTYTNQAPQFAPMPVSSEMPMQANFPHSQLMQQPVSFSNEAPVVAPPPAPLQMTLSQSQMPVEAHMPLQAQLYQEPFLVPVQAPVNDPPQAPLQMPMEDHQPPAAEVYNQEVAEHQHLPQGYENNGNRIEIVEPSQPLAATGANDDGSSAVTNDNLFSIQQWADSPFYDEQFYLSVALDGGVPETDLANIEQASSTGLGNGITDEELHAGN
uniref:MADS-box domain-containing protein n=1 Tax=Leersia perrieri TaxID=77586 RepID=A0A0D9UY90_9ORYZ